MASQPTGGQSAQRPVRLFLAAGMVALILLVAAVASGVLTSGSRNGDTSQPPPAPIPSTSPSDPDPEPTSAEPSASQSNPDAEPTSPGPGATDTGPDGYGQPPPHVLIGLVGVWVAADGSLELTIRPDGSFRLAQPGAAAVSGRLASRGPTLSLVTDAGGHADLVVGSAGHLTLVSPGGERVDFTRRE